MRVAGDVYAVCERTEPRHYRLPSWFDLTAPDDRFVASTLLLQSEHLGQTTLAAVGLPYVELPTTPSM